MIVGFKTGPQNWQMGRTIVREHGARMGEVWFNVTRRHDYTAWFNFARRQRVALGLHHWGICDGDTKENLMTHHTEVREQSIFNVKQTIEIGASIGCVYVNVHPGAQALEHINFDKDEQGPIEGESTSRQMARQMLFASVAELDNFAREKGVLLTIETLPGREARRYVTRENVYNPGNASLVAIADLGAAGHHLANDIAHTAAYLASTEQDRTLLWAGLFDFTQRTARATRLLHINTMMPPFNGTDSHDGVTADDFAGGVFPSQSQVRELLALFAERDDVYAVPEPRKHMSENYRALLDLVSLSELT